MAAKIIWAVSAVIGVLLITIVLAGLAMWRGLLPVPAPLLALLAGARAPEHSARFYPENTIAYAWATLVPEHGQLPHMQEIWQGFNEFPAFRDLVKDAQDEFRGETGIDIADEILPWAGAEIAIGLLDFEAGPEQPVYAITVAVRDRRAAEDFLREWLRYMESSQGASFDDGTYQGADISVDEPGRQAYALTDDWLVFASGESVLEVILERIAADTADDSLAGAANFRTARAALPERRFASAYLDLDQAATLWPELDDDFAAYSSAFAPEWLAASAAWVERGIVVETAIPAAVDRPLAVPDLTDQAPLLPDDTLGYLAASYDPNLDHWRAALDRYPLSTLLPDPQLIAEISEGLSEVGLPGPPPELGPDTTLSELLDLGLDLAENATDINLEQDLFDHLDGQLVIAAQEFNFTAIEDDPANTAVDAVLLLSYRNDGETALQNTMDDIAAMIEEYVFFFAERDTASVGADADATLFRIAETAYAPGYILHDGWLTLGSTEQSLATAVSLQKGGGQNGDGNALAADPEHRRALGHLPDRRQFQGYVNLRAIIRQTDADDFDLGHDQYRVLRDGIGALVISAYAPPCADDQPGHRCATDNPADASRYTAILTLLPE